jgi:hypothetical protein
MPKVDNLIEDIRQNVPLRTIYSCNCVTEYWPMDTLERYESNLKTQPEDWYYRNNKIKYIINSHSYRTVEFDSIDWKESVLIFGCSNTFGVGLDEVDNLSNQLSLLLNRPVINLGLPASSINLALHNSILFKEKYSTFKAVVHNWSWYNRAVYYTDKNGPTLHGTGTNWKECEPLGYIDVWNKHTTNPIAHTLFASKISKHLWKDIPFAEVSFFKETADILGCTHLNKIDSARDLIHPGINTVKQAAKVIADILKL